ncbi:hypothetical protein BDZ89DRAFT_429768 [Hymenopellis radicata]|nr:hypothetical protein BDZ89DRAFT_429768 [Hymenopellis radicata]
MNLLLASIHPNMTWTAVLDISSTPAPPATVRALPQELLELVFEHLGSNFYSLRNCSLVCREWTLPSQRIIFRSVFLSAETHSKTWSGIFRVSPHIGGFVRELTVLGVACSGAISHEFITHLSTGLPFFPHLTRVVVRPSIGVSDDVLDILCRLLKTSDLPVPSLTLYFNTIHRFHDVFSHFCGLPVHHVMLDELGRLPDPLSGVIGTCETKLPWLKRLELAPGSVDTLELFIDWLADTRTVLPALQELRLNLWSVSELRELCKLVHFGELPRTIELFHCHVEGKFTSGNLNKLS